MSESAGRELPSSVRILSDLHLGHPASMIKKVEMLRPLLEGVRKVVFNGDSVEQHYAGWQEEGERMRQELVAFCEDLGVEAVFLRGNHDPQISEVGWLSSKDGKVMVTHGDIILDIPSPWSREYLEDKDQAHTILEEESGREVNLQNRWEVLQLVNKALMPKVAIEGDKKFVQHLLSVFWPPERLYQIFKVWAGMGKNAEVFLEQFAPECRVFIFGHYHRPAVIARGGRLLCNTGGYVAGGRALVVDLAEDEVVISKVVKSQSFHLGEIVTRHTL